MLVSRTEIIVESDCCCIQLLIGTIGEVSTVRARLDVVSVFGPSGEEIGEQETL